MKKSIIVALALASAFVISGCGGEDKKPAATPNPAAVQQTATFKEIGYYKSSSNQRSFCIYTNSKDKNEMIKYAQSKPYTTGKQTVVHFFDSEKDTPNNTTQTDFETAMWLDNPIYKENKKHMLGTFQKTIDQKEFWYEKDNATKEDMKGTQIK